MSKENDMAAAIEDVARAIPGAPPLPPNVASIQDWKLARDVRRRQTLPPVPPSRTYFDIDEDDVEIERTMDDEEWAEAQRAYERAAEVYARTGGIAIAVGGSTATVHAQLDDGSYVTLTWSTGDPSWTTTQLTR